jgi:hypothetical protein
MRPRVSSDQARLEEVLRGSAWFMGVLEAVRDRDPPEWLVAGGALYKPVWNHLHGYEETRHVGDVDVIFFDPEDLRPERDLSVERRLHVLRPNVRWQAKNQAAVHLWHGERFGYAVAPFGSAEEALCASPAKATAVGVRLLRGGGLYVASPLGLDDLFGMVLRRNPRRVSAEGFQRWVSEGRFLQRWPGVEVILEGSVANA